MAALTPGVRVGTAGWTLPRAVREHFGGEGTQLARYARRFTCVEINSSFYRPHRAATYARWAASVPEDFRFALKIPKDITHTRRLVGAEEPLSRFLDESYALGVKRDVLLVQLPPSFAYDEAVVADFFALLRSRYAGRVACEPRHATWFDAAVDDVLAAFDVARVAADPPVADGAGDFGGSPGFRYRRLHGSPRMYYSSYEDTRLQAIAQELRRAEGPTWCIFDNTAHGAATANALTVRSLLETSAGG